MNSARYYPFRITALTAAMTSLAFIIGCSPSDATTDGSTDGSVDVSGLSEQEIRGAAAAGATRGITANLSTFSGVMSNASVLENMTSQLGSSRTLQGTTRALMPRDTGAVMDDGGIDEIIQTIADIFDDSQVSQNGNVYTFDPDETQMCADPSATPAEVAECEAVLSNVTAEMTVNATANNEITAATTDFLYSQAVVATVDFTSTSGYYELNLSGLQTFMQGVNDAVPVDEQATIPAVMSGTLRASFTVTGDYAASMTLSVPEAITISDDSATDPVSIELAATDSLAAVSANTNENSMTAEIGLGAINLLMADEDDMGNSFPIQLALSALTGKAVVTDNGDTLTLTGIGVDGFSLQVDQLSAATLDIANFGATLSAAGGYLQSTLNNDFALDLALTNIRGVLADFFESTAESESLTVAIDAPANTQFTELETDVSKITGGPLTISMEKTGEANVYVEVVDGACLDLSVDPAQTIACPAQY